MEDQFKSRNNFMNFLKQNPGNIIICLSATWCKPCQYIKDTVEYNFKKIQSDENLCYKLDVDQYTDLYSFLKSRKMVNGVPTILQYKQGNESFIPDNAVSGGDVNRVNNFFMNI